MTKKQTTADKAAMRIVMRMVEQLDTAACVAVAITLDRDKFLEFAGKAFDFTKRWHDAESEQDIEDDAHAD